MLHDASLLSEEQESLLALFLEKDDFAIDRNVEKKPVITLRPEDRYKPFPLTDIQLAYMIGRDNASLGASNVLATSILRWTRWISTLSATRTHGASSSNATT